jgi:LAO/AO transport system kinase
VTVESLEELLAGYTRGERRCLARILSLVESEPSRLSHIVPRLPNGRRGQVIGLTGAPGSGKSTVATGLVSALRQRNERVAVLAVDPSSPFTGGALLGDRLRLREHNADQGVFIRSMASRGMLGGLAAAAWQAVTLMERFGFPWILVETVGVGQSEIDIARLADVTVLVLAPGMGDDIQVMKAGVMEIADIILVNKADREGASRTKAEVEQHLAQSRLPLKERAAVLTSVATTGQGVAELLAVIDTRAALLNRNGQLQLRRAGRLKHEIRSILSDKLQAALELYFAGAGQTLWQDLASGRIDTFSAASRALTDIALLIAEKNPQVPSREEIPT